MSFLVAFAPTGTAAVAPRPTGDSMRADPAMASVYNLKPKFQNLLRPVTNGLAQAEVTANQVTIATMLFSVATGDVVSDSALYLPLAVILPLNPALMVLIVLLAATSEMAGVVAALIGATRRYQGPMGKSDRALVFGALGLLLGLGVPMASGSGAALIFPMKALSGNRLSPGRA